jgi:hypothetical protein
MAKGMGGMAFRVLSQLTTVSVPNLLGLGFPEEEKLSVERG